MNFCQEIDSYDISVEDDDTVGDILLARWTFLSFSLVQICAEISQEIDGKRPMRLISLLHVGSKALLSTEQYQSVEELFGWFEISVDNLVNQYEASGDELFCHCTCALNCAKALNKCKKFHKARDTGNRGVSQQKRCSIPAGQVELSQHRDNFTFSWHYSEFHG